MSARWRRRLYVVLFLVAAFLLGSTAQEQLGISFSVEGLEQFRLWVQSLGWWGPAVFILLVICRLFIGLSSHVILTLGGLAFGAVGGIIWGTVGLIASAMVLYFVAAQLGADWVQQRFGDHYAAMLAHIQKAGAAAVFALTAHPIGLLTPAHLAAGLVGLGVTPFAVAVSLAAPIRTAPYAFLGTAVLDLTVTQSLVITVILILMFVVPLFFTKVRAWVLGSDDQSPQEKA